MWSVFAPAGPIAAQEMALMINAVLLMLIVVVPVFVLLFFFAWRYRAGNTKAKYVPDWEHSAMDELVWWAVPLEIILVLAALTWSSTHALDPKKAIESAEPQFVVQVVALPWQWLFIYPSLGVATLNDITVPAGVPVRFDITADAPMNSFWVPRLGGQIYAMTGMVTTLNLEADQPGEYPGTSANYSGEGFEGMHFVLHAREQGDFDAWAASLTEASSTLDWASYRLLAQPQPNLGVRSWGRADPELFHAILDTFNAL